MPDVAAPMKQVFPKIEENNQTAIPKFLTLFGLSAELSSDEARFIAQRQKTPLRLSPSVSIVQDMIQRVVAVLNAAQSMVCSCYHLFVFFFVFFFFWPLTKYTGRKQ